MTIVIRRIDEATYSTDIMGDRTVCLDLEYPIALSTVGNPDYDRGTDWGPLTRSQATTGG